MNKVKGLKKILVSILMFICSIGKSQCANNLHYQVRITLFTPLMSEKYFPGHIQAEILDTNRLIKTSVLHKDDYYYINYWPSGNKKPVGDSDKKYKGVISTVVCLDKQEIVYFIKSANEDSKRVTKLKNTFGDWRVGYNLLLNNCADAVARAFNLKLGKGISIPTYVYNKIKNK